MRTNLAFMAIATALVPLIASARPENESFKERRERIAALPVCSAKQRIRVDEIQPSAAPEGKMRGPGMQGKSDANAKKVRAEQNRKREDRAAALGCRLASK